MKNPFSGGMPPESSPAATGPDPEHSGRRETWEEAGAPRYLPSHGKPVDQIRGNVGSHWEKTRRLWPQSCPSIPVIEGMLLAEIPKMLLLLFSQGAEQLALAPAPAFAHSERSSLSDFKCRVSHQEVVSPTTRMGSPEELYGKSELP